MAKSYRYFVTCPSGFEYQLVKELEKAASVSVLQKQGGAEFTGSFADGLRVCLWSRIAGKVLLALEDFHATDENEIYERASRIKWSDFFTPDATIAVDTTSLSRNFNNSSYLSLLVKDGISDHFRGLYGKRPDVDKENADIRINLFIERDNCTLSLDISGGSLHQRGYRQKGAQAPLKENLAAALLERAGWREMAFSGKGEATGDAAGGAGEPEEAAHSTQDAESSADLPCFIDPMCGSGTFLIEAAMMATNTAPGIFRKSYSFKHLKQFRPDEWRKLLDEAVKQKRPQALYPGRIRGFDIDREAVSAALINIRNAGFSGLIEVKRADISDIEKNAGSSPVPGLIAVNLPYGKRLGEDDDLPPLYRLTGEKLKTFNGWKVITVSGSEELSRELGMKPLQVNTVHNGPIKCVSALFMIDARYRDKAAISSEGSSQAHGEKSVFFSEMLANRIRKNIKGLKKWKEKEGISCFRIYDADLPEYSAAIDIYEEKNLYIQEYAPPSEIPESKAERRFKEIVHTVQVVTGIPYERTSIRQKRRQKGSWQYTKAGSEGKFDVIYEGGLSFYVNFHDYLDTGIFLDHRIARGMIRELSSGKKFLNLFSYTATASVYACAGGASLTVSVDSNQNYCEWAEKNFTLNKMPLSSNRIVKTDSMEFLENDRGLYDIIFIDPPTFSNSKSRSTVFDLQLDHPDLIRRSSEKLTGNGIIIFSNNFKKFKLDDSIKDNFDIDDITERTVSPDFTRHGYSRRCWIISRKAKS